MPRNSLRFIRVQSLTNQALISDKCIVADSFFDRLRGLIGKTRMENGEGMLFPKCNDIHMWFMSIPIDVVFLSPVKREGEKGVWKVASVRENVQPWRLLPIRDGQATETLELPAGAVARFSIRAGDELCTS